MNVGNDDGQQDKGTIGTYILLNNHVEDAADLKDSQKTEESLNLKKSFDQSSGRSEFEILELEQEIEDVKNKYGDLDLESMLAEIHSDNP